MVHAGFELIGGGGGDNVLPVIIGGAAIGGTEIDLGIQRQHGFGHGVDAAGGNHVAGKRRLGIRVANVDALAAKIAVSHEAGGHRILNRALARIAHRFPGEIEEGLVLAVVNFRNEDRSADGAAKGVADLGGQRILAKRPGIESLVLVIPKERTMHFVSATLRRDSNVTRLAVLGRISHALHLDFRNRLHRQKLIAIHAISGQLGN